MHFKAFSGPVAELQVFENYTCCFCTFKELYLRNGAQKGLKMQQGLLSLTFWSLHIQKRSFSDV